MENIDWVTVVLQIVICWFWYKIGQASIIRAMARAMKENGTEVQLTADGQFELKLNTTDQTLLTIEREGNQYFAYSDQGQFLSQGVNFYLLFDSLKQQYPNSSFKVSREQSNLSSEEVEQMVKTIFEVFGDKVESNANSQRG